MTTLYTIGFTKTSAQHFFERLAGAGVRTLIDVRLRTTSQLAGFAKRDDLAWFLDRLIGATYEHRTDLAPTAELLQSYRSHEIGWSAYSDGFTKLLRRRAPENGSDAPFRGPTALLCSEADAEACHRRLVAEHVAAAWGGIEIEHL